MNLLPGYGSSLRQKFYLLSFGIIFTFSMAVSAILFVNQGKKMHHSLESKGKTIGLYVAAICRDALLLKDSLQLDAIVAEAHGDDEILYTVIEDIGGTALTTPIASLNNAHPLVQHSVTKFPPDSSINSILAAIRSSKDVIELSQKIMVDSSFQGTVRIGLSEQNIHHQIVRSITIILLGMLIMSLFLCLTLNIAANRLVLRPIDQLANAADQLATGDMSTRIRTEASGEMRMLCDSFNRMAEELDKTTVSKCYVDNIIKSMTETLIILNPERIIKDVNSAAVNLLGFGREELVGQPIDIIVDPSMLACHVQTGQEFLGCSDTVLNSKDGRKIPVFLSASLMANSDNTVQGYVCVARDMSDIKQAQQVLALQTQELARSNAELQKFAYIASHDLQEPLRKVTAFGDRLQEKCGTILGEQGLDYLTRMQNAARRMQVLINDLLAFSRVTTKGKPFESVDLCQVAREVISDLEIKIEQTSGTVRLGNLPIIDADPLQMRQLFQNLIGNALKFHRAEVPPLVTIEFNPLAQQEAGFEEERFQLNITDNGIGFEEKYADRIFEVFQRLHGRTEYEGTGIGLAICRKIVERHAGSIVARSNPGEGAEFVIQLPYRQKKGESTYGVAA